LPRFTASASASDFWPLRICNGNEEGTRACKAARVLAIAWGPFICPNVVTSAASRIFIKHFQALGASATSRRRTGAAQILLVRVCTELAVAGLGTVAENIQSRRGRVANITGWTDPQQHSRYSPSRLPRPS